MDFNNLPLDLKIRINWMAGNIKTYEHKGNLIYQIPKYNEYGNKIIDIFSIKNKRKQKIKK